MFSRVLPIARGWPWVSNLGIAHRVLKLHSVPGEINRRSLE
jgi:hypothetical protein